MDVRDERPSPHVQMVVHVAREDEPHPFATLLRQLRAEAGLTQEGLADRADLSTRGVQKLESGERLPYPVTLQRVARALGLTPEQRAVLQATATRPARPRGMSSPALSLSVASGASEDGPPDPLPRGTVTFLLLDVDAVGGAGAERWAVGEAMPEQLDDLVARSVARYDGLLLPDLQRANRRGAVFSGATAALAAAATLQYDVRWLLLPLLSPIRLRLALYTGEATPVGGHYAGGTLDQASALLAFAGWGQTLLAETTARLARGWLGTLEIPGIGLRDLGPRPLDPAGRAEHVFELVEATAALDSAREPLDELLVARSRAIDSGTFAEAMDAFDQAMALLATFPQTEGQQRRRLILLADQWLPFTQLDRLAEYGDLVARFEPEAVRMGDLDLVAALANRRGLCEWAAGSPSQAQETWTTTLDLCELGGSPAESLMAQVLLQWCRLAQADYDAVLTHHDETLAAVAKAPDPYWHVWALGAASLAHTFQRRWSVAVAIGQEAVAVANASGVRQTVSFAHGVLAFAGIESGYHEAGQEHRRLAQGTWTWPAVMSPPLWKCLRT